MDHQRIFRMDDVLDILSEGGRILNDDYLNVQILNERTLMVECLWDVIC